MNPEAVERFNLDAHIDGIVQFKEFVLAKDFDETVGELQRRLARANERQVHLMELSVRTATLIAEEPDPVKARQYAVELLPNMVIALQLHRAASV